jgi:ubiquinone/menaquinone biosynthesis C-methylase UbiE
MAVNNFHIWPDQNRALLEVRRVLKDDGMLLLPLRMKHPTRTVMVPPGFTDEEIVRVRHLLQQVGFQHIRTEPYAIDQGVTAIWATR